MSVPDVNVPSHLREEAGWRDYLREEPFVKQFPEGDDHLQLGPHANARPVWYRVLTYGLDETPGGGSVESMAGVIDWFDLKLTYQETEDLFNWARGDSSDPIAVVPGQAENVDEDKLMWKATTEWAERGPPRDASGANMRAALPNAVKTKTAALIGGLSVLATVGGAFGVTVGQDTPEARLLLAAGVWAMLGTLVWGALRDERELGALVRAWPRFAAYRPARYAYETTRLRTPEPYMVMAYATVAALIVLFWTLESHGKDALIDVSQVPWTTVWIVAVLAAANILVGYLGLRGRSNSLRAVYEAELRHLRPDNERRPPTAEPDVAAGGHGP